MQALLIEGSACNRAADHASIRITVWSAFWSRLRSATSFFSSPVSHPTRAASLVTLPYWNKTPSVRIKQLKLYLI